MLKYKLNFLLIKKNIENNSRDKDFLVAFCFMLPYIIIA